MINGNDDMKISKRDKRIQEFDEMKIRNAVQRAFAGTHSNISEEDMDRLCFSIYESVKEDEKQGRVTAVEEIQDRVEEELMKLRYFKEAKSYILLIPAIRISRYFLCVISTDTFVISRRNKDLFFL